jgi:hypothetical protein
VVWSFGPGSKDPGFEFRIISTCQCSPVGRSVGRSLHGPPIYW